MGDAQGSLIVMISVDDGSDIAAAVFRPHPKYCATHLQCFVVRPELRGQKFAVPALAEVCDNLLSEDGAPQYVTWAVREGNAPMLRVSSSVGDQITTGEELVHFVHP